MRGIITADWHLRQDLPRCRSDKDWIKTQFETLSKIATLAKIKDCPIYLIGDIFNTPRVPPSIVSLFLRALIGIPIHILAGNHDLPYHSYDNINSSSFGILWNVALKNELNIQSFSENVSWHHFGTEIQNPDSDILFTHELIFPTEKAKPPNVKARTAGELLKAYPDKKWIFTGDYHHSFIFEKNGRKVINPGCINIQAANMKDYVPKILYIDTEKNVLEWIEIPDNAEVITDMYLREEEERNDRIQAFVDSVESSENISLDFLANLEKGIKENNEELGKEPIKILNELIEEVR